jgi:taurine dioxygenase
MSVTLRPFAAGLGADISGVDIREPLDSADRDAIRAAWLANLVLRFRGQPMTDEQHMAFTRQFGELEFNPAALIARQYGVETQTVGRNRETPPEISVISNIIEDGKAIGGLGDGEAFWHTDSSFVDVPPAASLLRALEVPPPSAGGATSFLNCYTAYDTLPEATKKRIDGRLMIHAATHSSAGKAHRGFEKVDDVSRVPGGAAADGTHASGDGQESALSRSPHQRLCHRAAGGRERGIARRVVDAYDPGKVYLDARVESRRSGVVGQSLRHASPRRLRSGDAPADAPHPAQRHPLRLTD